MSVNHPYHMAKLHDKTVNRDSSAERPDELARPYLHEFLTAAYEHYDLVIWSATSMKWIDVKMRELGVSTHPDYKLTCCLDHQAMVTVRTDKHGESPESLLDCSLLEHDH